MAPVADGLLAALTELSGGGCAPDPDAPPALGRQLSVHAIALGCESACWSVGLAAWVLELTARACLAGGGGGAC